MIFNISQNSLITKLLILFCYKVHGQEWTIMRNIQKLYQIKMKILNIDIIKIFKINSPNELTVKK